MVYPWKTDFLSILQHFRLSLTKAARILSFTTKPTYYIKKPTHSHCTAAKQPLSATKALSHTPAETKHQSYSLPPSQSFTKSVSQKYQFVTSLGLLLPPTILLLHLFQVSLPLSFLFCIFFSSPSYCSIKDSVTFKKKE